jgi:hypothetical protein
MTNKLSRFLEAKFRNRIREKFCGAIIGRRVKISFLTIPIIVLFFGLAGGRKEQKELTSGPRAGTLPVGREGKRDLSDAFVHETTNNCILLSRLSRDPQSTYGQAVVRFSQTVFRFAWNSAALLPLAR